jgi:hypothetical protein
MKFFQAGRFQDHIDHSGTHCQAPDMTIFTKNGFGVHTNVPYTWRVFLRGLSRDTKVVTCVSVYSEMGSTWLDVTGWIQGTRLRTSG